MSEMNPQTRSKRPLWIAFGAVVVLVLVAAGWWLTSPIETPAPTPAQPATQPEPATAQAAPTPYLFKTKTALAETELKLPQILAGEPDLHARLYAEGVHDLKRFAEGTAAARAEEGDAPAGMGAFTRTIAWTNAADTGKLLSLRREVFEFAGGAHPNTALDALLWDKALRRPLQPSSLIRRTADYAKLDAALCQAVTEAKQKRMGADYAPPGDAWSCPKWSDSALTLAPSTTPGKAGGLTFLFSPSAIGAYAEGPYEITLPQSAFRWALSPAYLDEFSGSPKRVGDTTPKP
jgi:hypothetical protein